MAKLNKSKLILLPLDIRQCHLDKTIIPTKSTYYHFYVNMENVYTRSVKKIHEDKADNSNDFVRTRFIFKKNQSFKSILTHKKRPYPIINNHSSKSFHWILYYVED